MMKYEYTFVRGTKLKSKIEIEVDENIHDILSHLDEKIKYNNRKNFAVGLKEYDTDNADIHTTIERNRAEKYAWKEAQREKAFESNKKEMTKKQLLKALPEKQALAYFYSNFAKMKNVDIAKVMGNTEGAIRKLLIKAAANIYKLGITVGKTDDELELLKAIFY